ncbi:uncharacterized protein LOC127723401 [Mytilus californianus]|uniref:uncharacterized protein LOC127723401 n=1 Tax=Mytilus californianus TaxID=6549 RepID=UPI002245E2FE|nr:uncharacterized protein LOC127723401 [Mytilus californianus]
MIYKRAHSQLTVLPNKLTQTNFIKEKTFQREMKYTVLALVCIVVVNGYSFKRTDESRKLGEREKLVLKKAGIELAKSDFDNDGAEVAESELDICLEFPVNEIGECLLDAGKPLCKGETAEKCEKIENLIQLTIAVGKNILESGCLAKEVADADIEPCLEGKCIPICNNVCDDLGATKEECNCEKLCEDEERELEGAIEELESEEERSARLSKLRKLNLFRSVLNKRYFGNLIKRK